MTADLRKPVALAITGATTSGKSALAVGIAESLGGEIISMDSRQIYRGMDVGTDKVDAGVQSRIPHHGLDIRWPDERYSAGQFARDARGWIREICMRERLPILAGGTGFFLRALEQPLFREPALDGGRRRALRKYLRTLDKSERIAWLECLDPDRAASPEPGGPHRVLRAIEVAVLTGHPIGWWHRNAPPEAPAVPLVIFLLEMPRDRLFRQIDERVDRMIQGGLVEEVESLLSAGYSETAPGMTGTGYREVASFLRGECSLDEAADEIRRITRGYAKRQLTWFRNQLPADRTIRLDGTMSAGMLIEMAVEAWREWELTANCEGVR